MAKKEIVSVILIMLLLIASSNGDNEFDYYQIALQWQPATCSSASLKAACVNDPTNRFSVHGVWPSLRNGDYSTCSGTPPYDGTQISTIRARLNEDWPSVIYGTNPTLWSHEWTSHGTCSFPSLSQLKYFEFGLDTYDNNDVLSILKKIKIEPDGYYYSMTDIKNGIHNKTGMFPALRCNKNYWTNEIQLHEIVFCFTKRDQTLQNCPLNAVTCGNTFYWYSWENGLTKSNETSNLNHSSTTTLYDVV